MGLAEPPVPCEVGLEMLPLEFIASQLAAERERERENFIQAFKGPG